MRPIFTFLIAFAINLLSLPCCAQVCTGSLGAPVVNETFGSGASEDGPALPTSVTNYRFFQPACGLEDGQYSISSSMRAPTCKGGTWQTLLTDHTYNDTNDPNGYMMIINASVDPGIFYTQTISGSKLCPNTTYQFAAYIVNILRDLPQTQGYTEPNITFSIEKPDGTVIKTYNTGNIHASASTIWKQYGTFFTSPADGSDVVVKMINNGKGGNGNDLAMDDITVSPCGAAIESGFTTLGDITPKSTCYEDNLHYTLVAQQTGYSNPTYQWQQKKDNGDWTNIPGATTTTLSVTLDNAAVGRYQYHIGVLNGSQVGSVNCTIYSDPLTINVYPPPVVKLNKSTTACSGSPLQLSSSGGEASTWTGPNGYQSTGDSPVVTQSADPSYNGDYTVRSTNHGCPTFSTTTVTVYQKASVNPMKDVTICEGNPVRLNAVASNATHYKWSPSIGLDHDDIASPLANPAVTTIYTVEVSNDACKDITPSAQVTVNVTKTPHANAGADFTLFEGQTAKLNGTATGDNIISTYWSPPDFLDNAQTLTPHTSATDNITYTLHLISATCGESTSSVFVHVYKKVIVPNTFSPNNDGVNDFWNIVNLYTYPKATITVYNRNGQQVYQSKGYDKPWNGTYNGKSLSAGTYYYVIDLKEDNLPKMSGWVFIVK